MKLSVKRIEKLKQPGRYGDGHNLYLQINPNGVKSWLLRFERGGRERWMGLGPFHTFGLAEARERARKQRQLLADGIDPLAQRAQERAARALAEAKALTFEDAVTEYYKQHSAGWSNAKHAAQFLSTLETYAFPVIGKLPVQAIDTTLVLKVLDPIWQTKTETASRVRNRIEAVLGWATGRGYRTGDNPAAWRGHLKTVLPARTKIQKPVSHAALPFAELPAFIDALHQREAIAARALEFTILTAGRTGEIIGAKWDEFDLQKKVWIIPAERMKAGKKHRVPLSGRAINILQALPRKGEFVFAGERQDAPLGHMAMSVLLNKRMGRAVTVHGFRSSFRDWASETTGFPHEVCEMALAHSIGDKTEEAYRRGDLFEKRRKLMDAWAKFATTPVQQDAKVIPIRGKAVT